MRFASLGSGSRGNGTLVEIDEAGAATCLLIDCGFSCRETERRMRRLDRSPQDLSAILVTHEHSDHSAGVAALARKYQLPVYATVGTAHGAKLAQLPSLQVVECAQTLQLGDFTVHAVAVPHDAREPSQFVFQSGKKTFGLLTDLGSITPAVTAAYRQCDALMLECNHDVEMLANGPYPYVLKRRVGGARGHLSNVQAAQLLAQLQVERLQQVVMSHLSAKNNTPALARAALQPVLARSEAILVADQEQGLHWCEIN